MKKFRVEVDGEEFIVNLEEIDNETAVRKNESSNTNTKSAFKNAKTTNKTKSTTKKSKAKAKKDKKPKTVNKPAEGESVHSDEIGENDITAPMPGSILDINVKKGDQVSAGDIVIVLEAMKMENELTALSSGVVADIKVRVGDSVDAEDLLMVIE